MLRYSVRWRRGGITLFRSIDQLLLVAGLGTNDFATLTMNNDFILFPIDMGLEWIALVQKNFFYHLHWQFFLLFEHANHLLELTLGSLSDFFLAREFQVFATCSDGNIRKCPAEEVQLDIVFAIKFDEVKVLDGQNDFAQIRN